MDLALVPSKMVIVCKSSAVTSVSHCPSLHPGRTVLTRSSARSRSASPAILTSKDEEDEAFSPVEADIIDSFLMVDEDPLRGDYLPPNDDDNSNNNNGSRNHDDDYGESNHSATIRTTIKMDRDSTLESGVEPQLQDRQEEQGEQAQENQEQGQELGQGHDEGIAAVENKANDSDTNKNLSVTASEDQQDHDDSTGSFLPPPLPDRDDSSLLLMSSEDDDPERGANQTLIEEKEMRRKLMDMESSFLPEPSTLTTDDNNAGADDTYLVGVPEDHAAPDSTQLEDHTQLSLSKADETDHDLTSTGVDGEPAPQIPHQEDAGEGNTAVGTEPVTPISPAHEEQQHEGDTTTFENFSSPAAEAAERTVNRNQSTEADEMSREEDLAGKSTAPPPDQSSQQQQPEQKSQLRTSSQSGKSRLFDHSGNEGDFAGRSTIRRGNRPKYLSSRQSAQRLSYSSATTSNTEATHSDATLGADYALQSGGAAPGNVSQSGQHNNMARSVSLGSVASGISGYSDENPLEKRNLSGTTDGGLQTLNEEEGAPPQTVPASPGPEQGLDDSSGPMTPKAKPQDSNFPTDTAIAERVKDIQVPSTFARQFREDISHRALSPEKRGTSTPAFGRSGRSMTLKEQSSTIDRLSKENFDLKMRIHFLSEALDKRSEEGIKDMISENVELKSDKLKLQKDNQGLKRKVRDLEKQVKDQQSDKESMVNHDPDGSDDEHRDPMQDEEMLFLRERVENYEVEIERLRSESIAREGEKRRLAEIVKSLNDGRLIGSDVGSREERVSTQYTYFSFFQRLRFRICGKTCSMPRPLPVSRRRKKTRNYVTKHCTCGVRWITPWPGQDSRIQWPQECTRPSQTNI